MQFPVEAGIRDGKIEASAITSAYSDGFKKANSAIKSRMITRVNVQGLKIASRSFALNAMTSAHSDGFKSASSNALTLVDIFATNTGAKKANSAIKSRMITRALTDGMKTARAIINISTTLNSTLRGYPGSVEPVVAIYRLGGTLAMTRFSATVATTKLISTQHTTKINGVVNAI